MNKTGRAMLCALVLGLALPLFANAAEVSIEPQPLGTALQELARQSGVQILFFSKAVEGHRASALKGTYEPAEAVALLLEGSGLTYTVLNERAIEVAAKPAVAKPVTPPPSPMIRAVAVPLDEVEVIASRQKLNTMREELQRLDEEFYAVYNKLNTSPQYEIVCRTEPRRDRRLARRICEPAYVEDARRDAAAARAEDPCAPTEMQAVLAKTADHQKNMTDLVERYPELRTLLKERNELAERYEALRKESLTAAARKAEMKKVVSSSRASASALIASLGGCPSKEWSFARLSTEEWAVAKGLEPVELEGKRYFCLAQPGVEQPIRNSATCAALNDLRRARFGTPPHIRGFQDFDAFSSPNVSPTPSITVLEVAALHGVPAYPE